jgi:hypothetical protein
MPRLIWSDGGTANTSGAEPSAEAAAKAPAVFSKNSRRFIMGGWSLVSLLCELRIDWTPGKRRHPLRQELLTANAT